VPDRLFESKFDRDGNFETPVAVFVLEVELCVVPSGPATVGHLEQPESIDSALVDGVFGDLIGAVTEIETSLCGCGRPRGECALSSAKIDLEASMLSKRIKIRSFK